MITPFTDYLGIETDTLAYETRLQNHLGSIHAGAQFTFAERASGMYLASLFPDIKAQVIPLLRESNMKYKKQALSALSAKASVDESQLQRFKKSFDAKGRASIVVDVALEDSEGDVVCVGSFKWFVERKA